MNFPRFVGVPSYLSLFCYALLCVYSSFSTILKRKRKLAALLLLSYRLSKGAKIRNRYNQVPHLTQDTNGKVTNSQLDTTNESQEASPFPAGAHKAHINRSAQRHSKHKTEKNPIKDPQKKYRLGTVSKIFYWRAKAGLTAPTSPLIQMWIKTYKYLVCMKDP